MGGFIFLFFEKYIIMEFYKTNTDVFIPKIGESICVEVLSYEGRILYNKR